MATKPAKKSPPEAYIGASGFVVMLAAMSGADSPAIRFRRLAMPVPVPRLGAGKTSGVLSHDSIKVFGTGKRGEAY